MKVHLKVEERGSLSFTAPIHGMGLVASNDSVAFICVKFGGTLCYMLLGTVVIYRSYTCLESTGEGVSDTRSASHI